MYGNAKVRTSRAWAALISVVVGAAALTTTGQSADAQDAPGLAHVEKHGSGDTDLVLIHGLNADWRAWELFMTDLENEERYTMYAVTLEGFGGSEPPEVGETDSKTPRIDHAVRSVARLIEDRGLTDAVVVGHASLGGFIAIRLGVERPDLVSNLIIVDALVPALPIGGNMPPPEQRAQIVDMLAPKFKELDAETWESWNDVTKLVFDKDYHDLLADMMAKSPREVSVNYLIETMRIDLTDDMVGMQTPALFMYSWPANMEENEKKGRYTSMQTAAKIPGGDYVTVGRAQKYIMLDRPEGFTFLVDRYLTEGDVEAALP